jgi:hypothetical protein
MFFDGKASQIFGMAAQLSTMPEREALRASCALAVRDWFEELGRTSLTEQVQLFELIERQQLRLDLPEPAAVTARRARTGVRTGRARQTFGRAR